MVLMSLFSVLLGLQEAAGKTASSSKPETAGKQANGKAPVRASAARRCFVFCWVVLGCLAIGLCAHLMQHSERGVGSLSGGVFVAAKRAVYIVMVPFPQAILFPCLGAMFPHALVVRADTSFLILVYSNVFISCVPHRKRVHYVCAQLLPLLLPSLLESFKLYITRHSPDNPQKMRVCVLMMQNSRL